MCVCCFAAYESNACSSQCQPVEDPTPRRNISKFNGHFFSSVLKFVCLSDARALKGLQKFLQLEVW